MSVATRRAWRRCLVRPLRRGGRCFRSPRPRAVELFVGGHRELQQRGQQSVSRAESKRQKLRNLPSRENLLAMSAEAMENRLASLNLPAFRARQVRHWIYDRGCVTLSQITELAVDTREKLARRLCVEYGDVRTSVQSRDGTVKWLVQRPSSAKAKHPIAPNEHTGEGEEEVQQSATSAHPIECVFIPKRTNGGGSRNPRKRGSSVQVHPGAMGPQTLAAHGRSEGALCISSQRGCSLSCTFCHTGALPKQGVGLNLTAAEIVGQVMIAKHALGDYGDTHLRNLYTPPGRSPAKFNSTRAPQAPAAVQTILFMGMGEPLYNVRHVTRAINTFIEDLGMSRQRITVSTSGVVPGIDRLGQQANVNLALSLHAVRNDLRDELVPLNRTFPLEEVMAACRRYPGQKPSRRLTVEYVMLRGVNDSLSDAREMARLLKGLPVLINLIPFNPWPGSPYDGTPMGHIIAFQNELNTRVDRGTVVRIRQPRGRDIMAACGQLAAGASPGLQRDAEASSQSMPAGHSSVRTPSTIKMHV